MELAVGGDHRRHRATPDRLATLLDQRRTMAPGLLRVQLGGLEEGQPFHHGAKLVEVLDIVEIERRDDAAHGPARRAAPPLFAQQQQRLLDRLPGDPELVGDLLLDDARARCQTALTDLAEDRLLNLFDEIGLNGQLFHACKYT